MRLPPAASRLSVIATAFTVLVLLPACTVEAGDEAAHAMAEKFAAETASSSSSKAAPKVAVADPPAESKAIVLPATASQPEVKIISQPLAEPKSVPEKKASPATAKSQLSAKSPSAERKQADAKRKAQEKAEADRIAKAQRKADEEEMLARARAEAEERRLAQEKRLRDIERAEAEAEAEEARKAAEASRMAEQRERERQAEEQRKAAEARRLAEIAAQEEARRIAEAREREAEQQRKADEARRLAELAAQQEARRIAEAREREAEQQRKAAETRMRAELAAQEEARRAEHEKLLRAAEQRRLAAERMLAEEEARRVAQAKAVAELAERTRQAELAKQYDEEEARAVRHEVARLEAEREAENQRLSDRLRQIRTTRPDEARTTLQPPFGLGGPWSAERYVDPEDQDDPLPSRHSTRVTILLLMEPGHRGIRRFNKTGDPILCLDRSCYVSQGAGQPAHEVGRNRAFGPGVALGSRAGSCENSLTCVFRDVDLGGRSAEVQPIDLRVLRHDRREISTIEADRTCRVTSGQLTCRRPVIAGSYTLWIVPEAIAEQAGAMALETAVRSDTFYDHSASLNR